jgi:hypothetical protein
MYGRSWDDCGTNYLNNWKMRPYDFIMTLRILELKRPLRRHYRNWKLRQTINSIVLSKYRQMDPFCESWRLFDGGCMKNVRLMHRGWKTMKKTCSRHLSQGDQNHSDTVWVTFWSVAWYINDGRLEKFAPCSTFHDAILSLFFFWLAAQCCLAIFKNCQDLCDFAIQSEVL